MDADKGQGNTPEADSESDASLAAGDWPPRYDDEWRAPPPRRLPIAGYSALATSLAAVECLALAKFWGGFERNLFDLGRAHPFFLASLSSAAVSITAVFVALARRRANHSGLALSILSIILLGTWAFCGLGPWALRSLILW